MKKYFSVLIILIIVYCVNTAYAEKAEDGLVEDLIMNLAI